MWLVNLALMWARLLMNLAPFLGLRVNPGAPPAQPRLQIQYLPHIGAILPAS